MINRIKGPEIKEITVSDFPDHQKIQLPNGMDLYILNAGTQDIFKLDIINHGGRRYESKAGVGRMCASMMKEGIEGKSPDQLSELWDYYGAIFNSFSDLDTSGASLTSLNKHSQDLLPSFFELLNNATFPLEEINNKKKIFAEKLKRELSKNDVIGYRELTSLIYGSDHIYGYNTSPEDFDLITRQDIVDHYNNYWGAGRCFAILSGKISSTLQNEIEQHLSSLRQAKIIYQSEALFPTSEFKSAGQKKFPTSNKMQAAVKIGCATIHREDPDYTAFYLLSQILGGYFGSRLMKNLREEKGLCYNIYSSIDRLKSSNYFYISAEVDSDKVDLSLSEIKKEVEILKTKMVSNEELKMVKNYINGKILAGLDGPFRSSQLIKSFLTFELDFKNFQSFNQALEDTTPEHLLEIANKYLVLENMTEVIVGP